LIGTIFLIILVFDHINSQILRLCYCHDDVRYTDVRQNDTDNKHKISK